MCPPVDREAILPPLGECKPITGHAALLLAPRRQSRRLFFRQGPLALDQPLQSPFLQVPYQHRYLPYSFVDRETTSSILRRCSGNSTSASSCGVHASRECPTSHIP